MITFATGCSGIGAPEVAWHDRLGWKPLWCSEIEPFPSAVLKHRWPDVPNVGDFLTIAQRIDRNELEAPDVFCAGTPCQAFSVAGLRNSLNDHRGGLTLEYIRIADAMDAQRKRRGLPETVFVWENVPGVFSTRDNAFGCFLGGMLGLDAPVVPAGGKWRHYGDLVAERRLAWRLLDAQYFGVAQRRRRVFVVATARPGVRPARALFELGCVPRTAPPSREAWAGSSSEAQGSARTASWWDGGDVAESLTCTSAQQYMPDKRRFQAVMCAPINSMVIGKNVTMTDRQTTGIGEDGEPSPTLQANHHHAVVCSQYGEIAGALTARYDSSPCVDRGQTVVASFMGGQGEKAGSLGFREECAPTLKGAPSGSNQVPDVLVTDKQCVSTRNLSSALTGTEACPAHAKVVCYENNPTVLCRASQQACAVTNVNLSPTLAAAAGTSGNNQPIICYENNPTDARQRETDVSPSVLARWGTGGNQTPLVQTFSISENVIGRDPKNGGNHLGVSDGPCFTLDVAGVHGVSSTGFVRRLTTVECARLQGFPDHHTEIPWRGKPASECPNGPQYKAYGNSMCVNVMEWLGNKIQGEIYANSTSEMAR